MLHFLNSILNIIKLQHQNKITMKKIYTFLFFAAFFFSALHAQTAISVGSNTGQGTYLNPANPYGPMTSVATGASWNRHAYIYPASLLTGIASGSSIDSLFFARSSDGVTTQGTLAGTVNFKIYLKNTATNTFATGPTWSTEISGATLVYNSDPTVVVGNASAFIRFDVGTPFTYTGGNLEVLVEYTQSTATTGLVGWAYDNGTSVPAYITNSIASISGTTGSPTNTLSTLNLRHPSMLIYYTFLAPVNPGLNFFTDLPNTTCHTTNQMVAMQLQNFGTNPIAPGAAAVTLKISGANTYTATLFNTGTIAANGTETITFSGINLNTPGLNIDTAYVTMAGDALSSNDTLATGGNTANTIASFPAVENVETTLPLISYASTVAGGQLWTIQSDSAYINGDMLDSLHAHSGLSFFFFDSYRSPNSTGVVSRLFSNCVTLNPSPDGSTCTNNLSFFMSHDTTFISSNIDDSLYISVSADKGVTWNRIGAGFGRLDPAFGTPGWREEIVDLSAYAGQTIQIGFEGVSNWGSIIGLDDITVNSSCVTPLTLVSFTAQKQNKTNKLTWKTSQELNTLKFVIEQSKNGREFVQLGEVAAAGNSSTERTYNFTHNLPVKGYNYYRLKMVDIDGRFKYSPVRNLQNLGINEISSYPNPVRDNMVVGINADKTGIANVVITDVSGKAVYAKVYTVTEGDNNFYINTASLTAGNYIIKIQMSEDVVVKKFIKL